MSADNSCLSPPSVISGDKPECLTEIFRDEANLVVWERSLHSESVSFAHHFSQEAGVFERYVGIEAGDSVEQILPAWAQALPGAKTWLADVNEVVEMFGCLFEPAAIGVRLHVLPDTMCPRFHTDRVPVRLLVTYAGQGTEWLSEKQVRRGKGAGPIPDQMVSAADIQVIPTGAVSLLKGEAWIGNEGRGLVHRSPEPGINPRLVLGLDWLS